MDLQKVINEQFQELESSGKIKEVFNTHLLDAIDASVRKAFCYGSDFRKSIEQAVKDSIRIDLSQLNITEYNHCVLQFVREALEANLTTNGFEKMKAAMEELLTVSVPEKMKLSELIEDAVSLLDEPPGEISFHCVDSEYSFLDSYWVYFDDRGGIDRYSCHYRLLIGSNGKIAAVHADGLELHEHKPMGGLYGIERLLFRLYAAGTIIEKDPESVQTEWYED